MTATSVPSRSLLFLVASVAPACSAIAAIWASAMLIGLPSRARLRPGGGPNLAS